MLFFSILLGAKGYPGDAYSVSGYIELLIGYQLDGLLLKTEDAQSGDGYVTAFDASKPTSQTPQWSQARPRG